MRSDLATGNLWDSKRYGHLLSFTRAWVRSNDIAHLFMLICDTKLSFELAFCLFTSSMTSGFDSFVKNDENRLGNVDQLTFVIDDVHEYL